MLLNIVFGAFALLAVVVTLWSLAVAFSRHTRAAVAKHAREVFHIAWKTAIVAVLVAIVRLYASGAHTPTGVPTSDMPVP
jgi:hypothetical protein